MPDTATDYIDPRQIGPVPDAVQMPGGQPQAPPTPPPQPMSDKDAQGFIKEHSAITDQSVKRIQGLDAQRTALASQPTPRPPMPQFQDVPKPPDTQPLNVFKDAQPALIFSTVMGAVMARKSGMGAMAAATGFLEGWQKGDQERMDRERQKWDDNVNAVIKENDVQKSRYDVAWNNAKLTQTDRMAQINAIASSIGDEQTINALREGNLDFAYKLHNDRYNAGLKLYEAQHKAMNPQAYALQQFIAANPNATPEQLQAFIQSGRAGRSAITMYMNKYLQEHPEATSDEVKTAVQKFTTQTTAQNRFLSGPQGNTVRSLNVVVSHLQTMQDLGQALKNGDFVAFNRVAQTVAEQTGKAAPTNFDTAKQIVGAEVIKALGVAGAGTQSERQEAADAFNRARSPEQLNQAIEVARKLLIGQLGGLRRQFVASTGLPESAFDDMLEPQTRAFFDENHTANLSDDDLKKKLGIP